MQYIQRLPGVSIFSITTYQLRTRWSFHLPTLSGRSFVHLMGASVPARLPSENNRRSISFRPGKILHISLCALPFLSLSIRNWVGNAFTTTVGGTSYGTLCHYGLNKIAVAIECSFFIFYFLRDQNRIYFHRHPFLHFIIGIHRSVHPRLHSARHLYFICRLITGRPHRPLLPCHPLTDQTYFRPDGITAE